MARQLRCRILRVSTSEVSQPGGSIVPQMFSNKLNRVIAGMSAASMAICFAVATRADIIPPKVYATTPGGINVADGSLVYSVTDLALLSNEPSATKQPAVRHQLLEQL
jgi:hypothetical protein